MRWFHNHFRLNRFRPPGLLRFFFELVVHLVLAGFAGHGEESGVSQFLHTQVLPASGPEATIQAQRQYKLKVSSLSRPQVSSPAQKITLVPRRNSCLWRDGPQPRGSVLNCAHAWLMRRLRRVDNPRGIAAFRRPPLNSTLQARRRIVQLSPGFFTATGRSRDPSSRTLQISNSSHCMSPDRVSTASIRKGVESRRARCRSCGPYRLSEAEQGHAPKVPPQTSLLVQTLALKPPSGPEACHCNLDALLTCALQFSWIHRKPPGCHWSGISSQMQSAGRRTTCSSICSESKSLREKCKSFPLEPQPVV